MAPTNTKYIWVEPGPGIEDRVAFREVNEAHPKRRDSDKEGEAFVHAGNAPQKVAMTGKVMQALGSKQIVEVDAPAEGKTSKTAKAKDGDAGKGKDGKDNGGKDNGGAQNSPTP